MTATDTNTTVQNNGIVEGPSVDNRGTVHEAAVSEIVGLIRAKYEDEGTRNFAIGKRAFEHAQWQRGNFPGYTGSDFDTLMNRIRDDVRLYVTISAKSIVVAEWVRCHVLRELVREVIAEGADLVTMNEYRMLQGKALAFNKKDVEGTLVDGWADFFRSVASERMSGVRIGAQAFEERVAEHVKALAALAAKAADPVAAAAKVASDAIKAKERAGSKARQDITSSVSDALVGGHVSAEGVLGILENVAKHHKIALPTAIGFDPARCTVEDCKLLASTMFQAGKFAEMVALRDQLDKMVSAVEKARASAAASSPSLREIAPNRDKLNAENPTTDGSAIPPQVRTKPTKGHAQKVA